MKKDIVTRFIGSAGDGLASIGLLYGKILKKHKLTVRGFRSYQSVIRGGYNNFQIRCSSNNFVDTIGEDADIIVLFNEHVAKLHKPLVNSGARIIYDNEEIDLDQLGYPKDIIKYGLPLASIAKEITKIKVIKNTVAFGVLTHLLGLDYEWVKEVYQEQFGKKGNEVMLMNYQALDRGIDYAKEQGWEKMWDIAVERTNCMILTGNEAISLGMLSAGLRFYSGYPMTPASSIIDYLTKHLPKLKIVVKQTEDEIAACGIAIGASYCGARSATGTSGGGFALMTELVGMAAMQEIPLTIINSMRAGPSTGMATKTEQADLWQAYGASQGDFPKIIIAPNDIPDAFDVGQEALLLAEKYQMVVIVLMDLYLSESYATIKELDMKKKNGRYHIITEVPDDFKRYEITESGISPRPLPGTKNGMHFTGSSEHKENGTSIASTLAGLPDTLPIREAMVRKRDKKLDVAREELPPPKIDGPKEADITIVSWGSTKGIIKETMRRLEKEEGIIANNLHIRYISPFHTEEIKEILSSAKKLIVIEQNYSGQLKDLICMKTAIDIKHKFNKFNGELMQSSELIAKIKEVL